jgi:hypothetical protein
VTAHGELCMTAGMYFIPLLRVVEVRPATADGVDRVG